MANTFFSKFPTINYQGYTVPDITKSVTMVPDPNDMPQSFSQLTIENYERTDQLASDLYGDPYLDWLILLSNQNIDPYAWYMTEAQFFDFMNQKYGDWLLAQNKVKYYTNNWYNNDVLTPSIYNALSSNLTKYYQPQFDASGNVIQYVRTAIDWEISTNHIVNYYFTISIPSFIKDEIVNIQFDNGVTGNGQVCFTSNSQLSIQHIRGNYLPNNSTVNTAVFYITGQQSNSTITLTQANQISYNSVDSLPANEYVFYDPVSYFDYEQQINEARKYVSVLANNYAKQAVNEITKVLQ